MPSLPVEPLPQPETSQQPSVLDRLLGTNGTERYQLWPERLVRAALTAPGDVLASETPSTSESLIPKALDVAALSGTGGLAGTADATLGAGPFLRPALKVNGKIYKAPMNGQHMDAIPESMQADFTRKAMSGDDISHYNFGFMNHKGQFLSREDALQYAIDQGLLNPNSEAARTGTLTSTMDLLSDTGKPAMAIKGFEDAKWYHGTTHDFDRFNLSKGNPENRLGKYPHFTSSPEDASANYAGIGPDLASRIENLADQYFSKFQDKYSRGEVGDDYGKLTTKSKAMATEKLKGPHEGAVIPTDLQINNPVSLVESKPTWLDFTPKMDKEGEIIGDSKNATKLYNSLKKQGAKYGFDADKVMGDLADHVYDEVRASDFDKALRESENLMYAEDGKGKLVNNEVIANIYRDLGYDGIVMDAKKAFPHMPNIPEGTLHAAPLKKGTAYSSITGQNLFTRPLPLPVERENDNEMGM